MKRTFEYQLLIRTYMWVRQTVQEYPLSREQHVYPSLAGIFYCSLSRMEQWRKPGNTIWNNMEQAKRTGVGENGTSYLQLKWWMKTKPFSRVIFPVIIVAREKKVNARAKNNSSVGKCEKGPGQKFTSPRESQMSTQTLFWIFSSCKTRYPGSP